MQIGINKRKALLGEAQSLLHWDVEIVNPPKAIGAPPKGFPIRITTSDMPIEQEEYQDVELGGHSWTGSVKVIKAGEINFELFEGTDQVVKDYFLKLLNAKWSGDGKETYGIQHTMADLKCDVKITLRGPDDKPTRTYLLIGTLIRRTSVGSLGQTAELQRIGGAMKYDDFHEGTGGNVVY